MKNTKDNTAWLSKLLSVRAIDIDNNNGNRMQCVTTFKAQLCKFAATDNNYNCFNTYIKSNIHI